MLRWEDLDYKDQTLKKMKALETPSYFAEDPYFLGEKLYPLQKEMFDRFYREKKTDLIVVAGMRSGKTFEAALFSTYEAFCLQQYDDPATHWGLSKGSEIFIINTATSQTQARDTVFAQIDAKVEKSPYFNFIGYESTYDTIRLPKRIRIRSGGSNSASIVGRTAKIVTFDELARFQDTSGKRSGEAVYFSLSRATKTFGDEGYRIVISSPLYPNDFLMTLYKDAIATKLDGTQQHPHMLGYKLATWELNPNFTRESFEPEFRLDFAKALRDYGAEPTSAILPYYTNPDVIKVNQLRENILKRVMDENTEGIEPGDYTYVLGGDPAAKRDAFGIALGHREYWDKTDPNTGNKFSVDVLVIDGIWRFKPERKFGINPEEVLRFIMDITDTFPVRMAVFDTWNYPILQQKLINKGIQVENHVIKLPEQDSLQERFVRGTIDVCDFPFLIEELKSLELVNGRRVDHPPGGSKDVADAVALVNYGFDTIEITYRPMFVVGRIDTI